MRPQGGLTSYDSDLASRSNLIRTTCYRLLQVMETVNETLAVESFDLARKPRATISAPVFAFGQLSL